MRHCARSLERGRVQFFPIVLNGTQHLTLRGNQSYGTKQCGCAGRKPKKPKQSSTSGMSRALVRRETFSAYMFLLPSLVFFVLFVVIPMFICVFYSLFKLFTGRDQRLRRPGTTIFDCSRTCVPQGTDQHHHHRGSGGAHGHRFLSVGGLRHLQDEGVLPFLSSAVCSTCRWSPARWPSLWYGSGSWIPTTASSTSSSALTVTTGWVRAAPHWPVLSSSCSPPPSASHRTVRRRSGQCGQLHH